MYIPLLSKELEFIIFVFSYLQLLELLNRLHMCLAESSKYQFLDSMAKKANEHLIPQLASRNCKVIVDNIDGRTITNQVRVSDI